ncbi:TniQ family protein [Sideroxyarcus sp. TK5]
MSSSKHVIYETYPQKVSVPQRSRLFGLEPIGIGTPECESLISYLVRLARAHCMAPRDLIRLEFMWRFSKQEGIRSSGFFTEYSKTLNSVGKYASGFVRLTEELTGRNDLRYLTMLPWRGVIPDVGTGLLATEPKWCRHCLAQQRDCKHERYSPLVWSLHLYSVCAVHGIKMTDRCPRCARKQPFIPRLPMLDHCDYCGCWLGLEKSFAEVITPTERELWLAKAIVDMVSQGAYADEHVTQKRLQSILNGFVADYAEGEKRQMSRMLGLTETSMACWIVKGKKPLLPQLLDVCYQFCLLPVEMLSGVQPLAIPCAVSQPKLYRIHRRLELEASERERLRMKLTEIANDPSDHRTLTEVSLALGARKNFLSYWFRDICAIVTVKHREEMQRQVGGKWEMEAQRVRDEVARLGGEGIYPSRKKIEAAINPLSLRRRRLYRVYQNALARIVFIP